jgi:hypothetical protein
MAKAELAHGQDPQIRRLVEDTIEAQENRRHHRGADKEIDRGAGQGDRAFTRPAGVRKGQRPGLSDRLSLRGCWLCIAREPGKRGRRSTPIPGREPCGFASAGSGAMLTVDDRSAEHQEPQMAEPDEKVSGTVMVPGLLSERRLKIRYGQVPWESTL